MEFPFQDVSKTYSILFSARFAPFSNPRPCTMKVRNEPLHDMGNVVKREIPPNTGGNFVSFKTEKRRSVSEMNLIGWRG